jgi:oligo-1,6-glucosidase
MYPGDKAKHENALKMMQKKSRDNARTPIQWDDSPNAGFCPANVKPWMRVNDDYTTVNAAMETKAGTPSVYNFWSKVLAFRKKNIDAFAYGDYQLVNADHPEVLGFKRTSEAGQTWVSALNFTGNEVDWALPKEFGPVQWEVGNYEDAASSSQTAAAGSVKLRPWEGLVGRVS